MINTQVSRVGGEDVLDLGFGGGRCEFVSGSASLLAEQPGASSLPLSRECKQFG